jgi:tetratricopeptide (TPR) repeat protein
MTASQHFLLGLAHMELKEPAEAAEQMRQCLAKRSRPALSPVNPEIIKAGPNHCLALCLSVLKQYDAAEQAFRAALADDPKSRPAKFDFARLKFERGDGIPALQLLHELVAEDPKEINVWLLGGQIALSRPEYLEFAGDWTGEAIKHFAQNGAVMLQRAEALMLSGEAEAALPLWTKAHSSNSARHLAAIVLCENLAGDCRRRFAPGDEPLVSQEFLKWYRALIGMRASSTVERLNQGMDRLRAVLPTFAKMWDAAVKEARQPVSA